MNCRIEELRCKEVINVCDGWRLGFVSDVLVDTVKGCVVAVVIPGACRFFGLFGREDDYIIPWDSIYRISQDIILVEVKGEYKREKRNAIKW